MQLQTAQIYEFQSEGYTTVPHFFTLAEVAAMWIAIHDATIDNGTLKVVTATFNEHFRHVRDPASDHPIHTAVDESRAVHYELEAGGVVFFCFGTPHATRDNLTDEGRAGVGIHFVNAHHMTRPHKNQWEQTEVSYVSTNFDIQVRSILEKTYN